MTRRIIMHADCNYFYAAVEMFRHPELRNTRLVVGGEEDKRSGIVLAKSPLAKACGVKTGETLWEARKKCPGLIVVPPNYPDYLRHSHLARKIYYDYSDLVEPFGLDESWIDITGSLNLFGGNARLVAEEISERIKAELGITVSIGLSWNKVFSKLGSDQDTGDGIYEITPENYRETIWKQPVQNLLYVGSATTKKLHRMNIYSIGELAEASTDYLNAHLGKMGVIIQSFARGEDLSPVKTFDPSFNNVHREIKSIGNGLTAPHDLYDAQSAKALIYLLSESVGQRLRELHMKAQTVSISVRYAKTLLGYTRQIKLKQPTCITSEIAKFAFKLLYENEPLNSSAPIRALGVRVSQLIPDYTPMQTDLFNNERKRVQAEKLDRCIDDLRKRFGNKSIVRLIELADSSMAHLDIKGENIIHPVGYFTR